MEEELITYEIEQDFVEWLDSLPTVSILGNDYELSDVLKRVDPARYNIMLNVLDLCILKAQTANFKLTAERK